MDQDPEYYNTNETFRNVNLYYYHLCTPTDKVRFPRFCVFSFICNNSRIIVHDLVCVCVYVCVCVCVCITYLKVRVSIQNSVMNNTDRRPHYSGMKYNHIPFTVLNIKHMTDIPRTSY